MSENIGENIKRIRKSKKITQKELALLLKQKFDVEIGQSAISQYEKNIINISYDMLLKIAEALQVSINQLLGIEEETPVDKIQKEIESLNNSISDAESQLKEEEKKISRITSMLEEDPENIKLKDQKREHENNCNNLNNFINERENEMTVLLSRVERFPYYQDYVKKEIEDRIEGVSKSENPEEYIKLIKYKSLYDRIDNIKDNNLQRTLLDHFNTLNNIGKNVAISRVRELNMIKLYTQDETIIINDDEAD
ncbi:helix-turn-helix domain-containing protein [Proteiniclasticum sp. C24MP]|uniref:helix-turn-helix domain-containing protein n=1 Tax=Proteiniclasticum sp. C24MP TaxID=3374101 RepID=UPI003753FE4D